jgi:ankyrin repeat protein
VVQLLLAKGADPNLCNKAGASPLHAAIENRFPEVAGLLRSRGGQDLFKAPTMR